jgi:hypothetical protein
MPKRLVTGGPQGQCYPRQFPQYWVTGANPPIRCQGPYIKDSFSGAPLELRMAVKLPNGNWAMAQRTYRENDIFLDPRDYGASGPEANAPNDGDQPPYFGEVPAPIPAPLPWE